MSLEKNDKLVWVDINELKPHPKNTNKHPKEQIERLAKIINYQGFRSPIVVSNLSGFIVAGHGRLEAAKKLGLTKVPVSYQDFEDAKMELAHLNADNAIALWAEIDMKAMTESLKEINFDLDLDFLGFKDFKLDNETKSDSGDEDNIPETAENEFGVKLGDIYQLGEHRIMCGDSTDQENVAKLMDGQLADMVFTDPPYGMNAVSKSGVLQKNYKKDILGDGDTDAAVNSFKLSLKMFDCPQVWWGANYYSSALPNSECWIVWDKNNGQSDQTDCELAWTNFRSVVRQFTQSSEKSNRVHPTQKPVSLFEWTIERFANKLINESKNVVDLFLGSGSTLIACEKTNRVCYGMELDPHYMSVIIKRWQDYTKKTAVKL